MKNYRININEHAFFETYLLHNSKEYNVGKKRPLIIICPGGGYAFTSDREAEVIALKFNSIGINSIVLWYTVGDKVKNIPENALLELAETVKYVREHSDKWLIEENSIIVSGFSAGGHLALQMATRWNDRKIFKKLKTKQNNLKINLAIVGYPMVYQKEAFLDDDLGFGSNLIENPLTSNERYFGTKNPTQAIIDKTNVLLNVNDKTPPIFIWHTTEDKLIDVKQSLELGCALRENSIPFEMHIFEKGEHGLSLGDRTTARKPSHLNKHVSNWFSLCESWINSHIYAD